MVTGVELNTTVVVIAKVAESWPSNTVTDAGTAAAAELLLLSATIAPPAGAPVVSETVPVEPLPPMTTAGSTLTELREAGTGLTVRPAVCLTDS